MTLGCRTPFLPAAVRFALLMLLSCSAYGQIAVHEEEPNDTPETANRIAGAVRVLGTMAPDDQDGFLWSVSDVDAVKRWTIELIGIPAALTVLEVMRLEYADDGVSLTGREVLFAIGSRDGSRPGIAEDVIFEPGDYLLGVSRAGGNAPYRPPISAASFDKPGPAAASADAGGGYRLSISEGRSFGMSSSHADGASRSEPLPVRPGRGYLGYASAKESWFEVTISDVEAANQMNLVAQVPAGRDLRLTLSDADGNALSSAVGDKFGRLELPELSLAAGRYLVHLQTAPHSLRTLSIEPGGTRVTGSEAEPNDSWKLANRVDFAQALRGRFQRAGDADYFMFPVTESMAETSLEIEATSSDDRPFTLCLMNARGEDLQCRTGPGGIRLDGLVLDAGDYGLSLARGQEGTEYEVFLRSGSALEPGMEAEPNETPALATGMPANQRVRGSLVKDDVDFFRLVIDGEPQLWRIQVNGEGIHEVAYHDGSGQAAQKVRAQPSQRRVVLDNLFLLPGTHYVSVSGREQGHYTLLTRPLGPPNPNAEMEPNDDVTRMQPLVFGQVRTGTLPDAEDRDNYRFHLADYDHIKLTIAPPVDGTIRAQVYWEGDRIGESTAREIGGELVLEGLFPPGDYRLELIAAKSSDAEYRLSLDRLGRFDCATDCEPNDNPAFASALPLDGIVKGRVGEWRDDDWYSLPISDHDVEISIEGERRHNIDLVAHPNDRGHLTWDQATARYTGTIPGSEQRYLRVRGNEEYAFTVLLGDAITPTAIATTSPLNLALALDQSTVAAYQPYGQRIAGGLTLQNRGSTPVTVELDAAASDARWAIALDASELQVSAGATVTASLKIEVPDDAWADRPVRVSVQALDANGGKATTFAEIAVDRDAPLVGAVRHWEVPEPLQGGLNVASPALGGRWTGNEDSTLGQGLGQIFDGMAIREEGLRLRARNQPWDYHTTVELAGSLPVDVAGIVLNPLGRGTASGFLRRFTFALSVDGENFREVLAGALEPRPVEQYFVLKQPEKARFARLALLDDFTGNPGGSRALGEWKIIAAPGFDSNGGGGFNVANPARGGHVVWSSPLISQRWDDVILQPESPATRVRLRPGQMLEWVIGFHHNRAARITDIEWLDSAGGTAQEHVSEVEVYTSIDSPVGPWTPLGTWKLEGEKHLVFEHPTWARFVRFTTSVADADSYVEAPGALRINEQPADGDYRSILGEWGFNGHRAIYEALQPIAPARPFAMAQHGSRASAAALLPGQTVDGRVWLGRHEHWYKVQLPPTNNMLEISLAGEHNVRTVAILEAADGEPSPLRVIERRTNLHRLEAFAEPGSTVFLRIMEPPRNVVFAWDTSASVGAYLPVIYNAMAAYARDLVPGRDAANLMPFGSQLLMRDWHGEPYLLQTILNEYPRGESSSEAEQTLARASEALAGRAGTKAIVLITDAATHRDTRVWDAFDNVRPRVLALGLDSHGAFNRDPPREQDLLQDWAHVNGGHYSHLRSEGEMEVAFDRATLLLREPAPYSLTVNTAFREAPGSGELTVKSSGTAGSDDETTGAVLFILDASGSMLQRLEGKRRIDIARQVLVEAVTTHVQPGTPMALRVFGHREPNACRSDLEISLQPLEPAAAAAAIRGVEARNLARTPIADSLGKAESDLAGVAGPKTIVLLTDGEETCDGDPEAVIRRLVDKGFELRLNIVGFALGDAALERQFEEWAKLGGGRYFAANDAEALSYALEEALSIPFSVFDRAGTRVGSGVVDGNPLELPAGIYRVVTTTSPPQTFEEVQIHGGESVTLGLRQAGR